ncbi:MAG: hypothetical protein AAGC44_02240 [Planctomycetota bacterium]
MQQPTSNAAPEPSSKTPGRQAQAKPLRLALVLLIAATASMVCHFLPQLLEAVFEGIRRPRDLQPLMQGVVMLLAAAGGYRILTEPGRGVSLKRLGWAAVILMACWWLARLLAFFPSRPYMQYLIEAFALGLVWFGLVGLSRLFGARPRVRAWFARIALVLLLPIVLYLALTAPLPGLLEPVLRAVPVQGNGADKTAHFWVAWVLTALLAWAGPVGRRAVRWMVVVGLLMFVAAPLVEGLQGRIGRGNEPSDAIAHSLGTLAGLAMLVAMQIISPRRPAPPMLHKE